LPLLSILSQLPLHLLVLFAPRGHLVLSILSQLPQGSVRAEGLRSSGSRHFFQFFPSCRGWRVDGIVRGTYCGFQFFPSCRSCCAAFSTLVLASFQFFPSCRLLDVLFGYEREADRVPLPFNSFPVAASGNRSATTGPLARLSILSQLPPGK
jgi:hypothetical protein